MPQRSVRTAEIVACEVERHVSIQAVCSFGESQRFPGQSLVLLADCQVAPFDERRGDAGSASIYSEYLSFLYFHQMSVPVMFNNLGITEAVIRNDCWHLRPATQAGPGERDLWP